MNNKHTRIRPCRTSEADTTAIHLPMENAFDQDREGAKCKSTSAMRVEPIYKRKRKRKRQVSAVPFRNNACYFSWKKLLLLLVLFESTILSYTLAFDYLQVDGTGDIVKQSARRERIARNLKTLSDHHQYEDASSYTYRVRPRIDFPQNDKILDGSNKNNGDRRKLQREWVDPSLLPNAFSASESFSADGPNKPNPQPSAFSDDVSQPNPMPSGFSDDRPTQPTPRPTRGPISLPPHILPPIFVRPVNTPRPTPSLTRQPTATPTATPTSIPTAPEPSPVQEPPGGGDPVDPPEPGGGGEPVDPPEPGGGTPVDPPGPGGEPPGNTSAPTAVGAPGGGGNEPGGGGNQPGTPSGNEPGGGGNEPGTPSGNAPGNEPGTPGSEPGGGGNQPGNEPGTPDGGGNEPGGAGNEPGEPNSTAIPTQIPSVANEPGGNEPGNQPGEPDSGNNQPGGNQPGEPNGGGDNEPGEPGGESPASAPVEIPTDGGGAPGEPDNAGEPGEPVTVAGQEDQEKPVTMTIAALNSAETSAISFSSSNIEENSTHPTQEPTSKDEYIYSPGSAEWEKERIIMAEAPPFELRFAVFSKQKNLQPSVEDRKILEILTSEHMLQYSNSMIGSNLLAIDGLVLRNIIVTGEVRKPSRKLSQVFEDPRIGSTTNWFELESQEQTFVFTFRAKFIFMHWTNIAWALDLEGLSKNLVVSSLADDEKDNFLTTLQAMSSSNHTDGIAKDFLFASTRDMMLAPSLEIQEENEVEEIVQKEEQNGPSPFVKPEFPGLSALAFVCLGLSIVMCLLRWRIENKRQRWLKKGTKFEEDDDDDEITLLFSDTKDEAAFFPRTKKEPKKQSWPKSSNHTSRGKSEKTPKTLPKRETSDEVTVVFSDSSTDNLSDDYPIEHVETNDLNRNINWGLDYMIYNHEKKKEQENGNNFDGNKHNPENHAPIDNQDDADYRVDVNLSQRSNWESAVLASASSVASMSDISTNDEPTRSKDTQQEQDRTTLSPPIIRRKPYSVLNHTQEDQDRTTLPPPIIRRKPYSVLKDPEPKTTSSRGDARRDRISALPEQKSKRNRAEPHHLLNNFPSPQSKDTFQETTAASNPVHNSKKDTSRKSLRNGYESLVARRRGMEKTTEHASNMTLDKHGVFSARRGALEKDTKHASNVTVNGGNDKSLKCGYFF